MSHSRQEVNRKLVKILSDAVEKYPDWRFGQILFNYNFITRKPSSFDIEDPFYEESEETLNKLRNF